MLKDSKHPFSGVLFLAFLRERRSFDARFSGALPLMFRLRGRRLCALRFPRMALRIAFGGFMPYVSCAGD